jgi:hypothetical protein
MLTLLSKCSKWRLSKKRGLVADGCTIPHFIIVASRKVALSYIGRIMTRMLQSMTTKEHRKMTQIDKFIPSNEDLGRMNKDTIRISTEALFKGVSTRFGLRTIEKYIENLDFIFCSSFPNLRLRFPGKHVSTFCSPNTVLIPLKSDSPGNAL